MIEERMRVLSPSYLKEILRSYGVKPRSSLGQNFLIDRNVLRIIEKAARLSREDVVIEVGAGAGALTQLLAEKCSQVVAIEQDSGLSNFLKDSFRGVENVRIIESDALKTPLETMFSEIPREAKMVSNLPYSIAATLLISWLRQYHWITEYTVMVQREVASRFTANPGSKDYSQATVKINYYSRVEKIATVSSNSFFPKPRVESVILRLQRYNSGAKRKRDFPQAKDERFFDLIVSAGFQQRRKKLVNSITGCPEVDVDQEIIIKALRQVCKMENPRAEDLSVVEFVKLSNLLCAKGNC